MNLKFGKIEFQDETVLIWYSGKEEKKLKLSQVSSITPGQRTVSYFLCIHTYYIATLI